MPASVDEEQGAAVLESKLCGNMVETQHELAVRYNDHSPLENMHSRVALDLARPWLATLDADARKRARSTWIELVLATDMKEHAAAIFQVEHALSKDPAYDARARANHTTCLKLLIHAADLSNPTKAWATYDRWTAKIMEEFYAQADREAELDLPRTVPPRGQCEMDKFQLGFIGFIRPLFVAASKIPGSVPVLAGLGFAGDYAGTLPSNPLPSSFFM